MSGNERAKNQPLQTGNVRSSEWQEMTMRGDERK